MGGHLSAAATQGSHRKGGRPWIDDRAVLGGIIYVLRARVAWRLANRRLTVRYERRADIVTALLHLACALIGARKLQPL